MKQPLKIYIIALFLVLLGCEKEVDQKSPGSVTISSNSNNLGTTIFSPTLIDYKVNSSAFDSICLWQNNKIVETHYSNHNSFVYSFEELGEHLIYLSVFYQGGKENRTSQFYVYVNEYEVPDMRFLMHSLDGYYGVFVGDSVEVEIVSETSWYFLDIEEPLYLLIDSDTIGKAMGPPYYNSPFTITKENHFFQVAFKDLSGVTRVFEEEKTFNINPPTEVEIDLMGSPYDTGCLFDDRPVKIWVSANENTAISFVEYYLNDELIKTESVNSSYYHESIEFNSLIAETYQFHVIVYDDRHHSVESEKLVFTVEHVLEIPYSDRIIELCNANEPNLIYAISGSYLFLIDTQLESYEMVKLPFDYAVSMDYTEEGLLFIASKFGKLAIWDNDTAEFEYIDTQKFFDLKDIDVDLINNEIFLVNDNHLYCYDLLTEDTISFYKKLSDDACLAYSKETETIIVGGDSQSSNDRFYQVDYTNGVFNMLDQNDLSGFAYEIILNSAKDEFLIRCWRDSGNVWDMNDFGAQKALLDERYPEAIAYDLDFDKIVFGTSSENILFKYNALDYQKELEFKIPIITYERVQLICPSQESNKWLVYVENSMEDKAKLAFVNIPH